MNRKTLGSISVLVLLGLLCMPSIASADDIVTWTVAADFSADPPGTGTVTGFFDFDFTTGQYGTIDITTSAGTNTDLTSNPGHTYTSLISPVSGFSSGLGGLIVGNASGDLTGSPLLFIAFMSDLTPFGGAIPIDFVIEGTCADSTCFTQGSSTRDDTGTVTAPIVSTPEPSELSLLGIGFGLLAGVAIRKLLVA